MPLFVFRSLYLIAPLIFSILRVVIFEHKRIARLLHPHGVSAHADADRP